MSNTGNQGKYWRISNEWYDFTKWLDEHPGGRKMLEMSRDLYDDATYAFEAHHHNHKKVKKMLKMYKVKPQPSEIVFPGVSIEKKESKNGNENEKIGDDNINNNNNNSNGKKDDIEKKKINDNWYPQNNNNCRFGTTNITHKYPKLCSDDSFYSVLRDRVADYVKKHGGPGYNIITVCLFYFVLFLRFFSSKKKKLSFFSQFRNT